jgi:hypothetical protein
MSPAAFRFIVRTGPNPGTAFDIVKERTLLGRDVTCDIVIGDAEVSREHSRLTRTPGGYVIEDLGSTNGTFVNGERIMAPRVLNSGDLVGLSENVTLTFSSTSPETAATVMSTPAASQTVPPKETPAGKKRPTPAPVPQPEIASDAEPKKRSPWLYAGCGCLVLLVILGVVGYLMDMYMPDVLYAPLKMLGF